MSCSLVSPHDGQHRLYWGVCYYGFLRQLLICPVLTVVCLYNRILLVSKNMSQTDLILYIHSETRRTVCGAHSYVFGKDMNATVTSTLNLATHFSDRNSGHTTALLFYKTAKWMTGQSVSSVNGLVSKPAYFFSIN